MGVCRFAIHKTLLSLLFLVGVTVATGFFGKHVPTGFLPEEDQATSSPASKLPDAASLQRTSEIARQAEEMIKATPGIEHVTAVIGYSMLSQVQNTYSAFFFVTLKDWKDRKAPEEKYEAIKTSLTRKLGSLRGAIGGGQIDDYRAPLHAPRPSPWLRSWVRPAPESLQW